VQVQGDDLDGLADDLDGLAKPDVVGKASAEARVAHLGRPGVEWPAAPDDRTLGIVGFSIFPHLNHEMMPGNTMADAEKWAADIAGQAYAIDDHTAIKVADGTVQVVSEGQWTQLS
jgi:dipeptidase E